MADNLIICPVGIPMTFDDRFDKENHWRYTNKMERKYETLIVVYNDFVPEPDTYDHILHMKGHKWQIIKKITEVFDVTKYRYIGCVDDDQITDIQSFNTGLNLAENFDFKLWQLSMMQGSGIIYDCLKQNKDWVFSETNFVEMGSTFFKQDKFFEAIDFFKELDFTVGWGIDKVFCDVLQCTSNVVHAASIYHPPNHIKPSYYDQGEAMKEMNHMIYKVYPQIMRDKYKRENWQFVDSQVTLKAFQLAR
jgi:hypothetical protein